MQLLTLAAVLPPLLLFVSAQPGWYSWGRRTFALIAASMACAWVGQRTELNDLGHSSWLADGSIVPLLLLGLLWVLSFMYLGTTRLNSIAQNKATQCPQLVLYSIGQYNILHWP